MLHNDYTGHACLITTLKTPSRIKNHTKTLLHTTLNTKERLSYQSHLKCNVTTLFFRIFKEHRLTGGLWTTPSEDAYLTLAEPGVKRFLGFFF